MQKFCSLIYADGDGGGGGDVKPPGLLSSTLLTKSLSKMKKPLAFSWHVARRNAVIS